MSLYAAPFIAALVAMACALALLAQRRAQARLVGRVVDPWNGERNTPSKLDGDRRAAILFFTGAACNTCHTVQKPALEQLVRSDTGPFEVRVIDVAEERHVARQYKVMSLPTTIVLDASGRTRFVNVGPASAEVLRTQLGECGLMERNREAAAAST